MASQRVEFKWEEQVKTRLAWDIPQKTRCIWTFSWGVVHTGGGFSSSIPASRPSGKAEGFMFCVASATRVFSGEESTARPVVLFDPSVPQTVSAMFFLEKDSSAMLKCWLSTKAWWEEKGLGLTHHQGGWLCPRQAKGSPFWRRGVAFTPDQDHVSRTTPHNPSLSCCLLNRAELTLPICTMRIQTRFKNAFSTLHKEQDESLGVVFFTVSRFLHVIAQKLVYHA